MKRPLLSHMKGRTVRNAKIVSAVSLGVIVYTCLLLNPTFSKDYYRQSSVYGSVLCGCGIESQLDGNRATLAQDVSPKMSILLGVLTMASKVERRNIIRLAYGVQRTEHADVTLRFVIGKTESNEEKLAVGLESLQYGDIIVLDCEENMNHGKSFMFFSTVAAMGVHYDYVMKLDDDSYVRTENLAKSLEPLPRTDLYYGYVLPCEEQNAHGGWGYMAGMGYVVSWDIVQWLHASPEVRNNTDGTEDYLMGQWLKAGGKAKNRVSKKPLFYDHPEFGGQCAHELIPETILVHQVKNEKRWFDVLSFFEGDRMGKMIAPAIASQPS